MTILGETKDDAAGEAFDKVAKLMGLPYPGGPVLDRMAAEGDGSAFAFTKPKVPGLDMSFSGLKTQIWQFLQQHVQRDPAFIDARKNDIAASVQCAILDILMEKVERRGANRYLACCHRWRCFREPGFARPVASQRGGSWMGGVHPAHGVLHGQCRDDRHGW